MIANCTIGFRLVGRLLAGSFYLMMGLFSLVNFAGMTAYAASKGVALPALMVFLTSLLLFFGGLSMIAGYKPVWGIGAILLFLAPTTLIMHDFWNSQDATQYSVELASFLGNSALMVAQLLFLTIRRPWHWSVDQWIASGQLRLSTPRLAGNAS
jgi:putative oxidoreductase